MHCYTCQQEESDVAPEAEKVHVGEYWRVALVRRTSLPGWIVVVPRRHTTRIADLTASEAQELGPLLVAVSQAIETVTGTSKTYLMQFAEAEGFAHVHIHVTPRSPDEEHRGPRVFAYLDTTEALGEAEKEALALRLRAAVAQALSTLQPT